MLSQAAVLRAAGHAGQVTVGGVPVPGAAVTAVQGDQRLTTSTDADGIYRFADLADGTWTLAVAMVGFAPSSREVSIGPGAPPLTWELTLLPYDEIARALPPPPAAVPARAAAAGGNLASAAASEAAPAPQGPFRRAGVSAATPPGRPESSRERRAIRLAAPPVPAPSTGRTTPDPPPAAG